MGTVYRAIDERLGLRVAIKHLPLAVAGDETRRRRCVARELLIDNFKQAVEVARSQAVSPCRSASAAIRVHGEGPTISGPWSCRSRGRRRRCLPGGVTPATSTFENASVISCGNGICADRDCDDGASLIPPKGKEGTKRSSLCTSNWLKVG